MKPKKSGLGRGLEALLKAAPAPPAAPAPAPGVLDLAVEELRPNRLQPRTQFDASGLDELADSIKAQGIVQPLVVSSLPEGGYTIVAGERRWRAAQQAGLTRVPAVLREVSGDQELLELALVENIQRRDLDPMEEAEAYEMLRDRFGLSQEEVARRVGKARTTVTNTLRLLRLPQQVQDLLRAGQLTPGQARPLLGLPDPAQQVELAERAAQEGLTARDLEKAARSKPEAKTKKAAEPVEVHAAAAAEQLTRRLQTPVRIARRGAGGEVFIRFHSEDELIRIYDLLMARGDTE
ncbi:MAG: ParB/RepB/Spo0J family partition protein [Acidobacteria bacterium]|nr:ParB/RepB/Spo0J family partition protein [Acidobacteriota bacterium]